MKKEYIINDMNDELKIDEYVMFHDGNMVGGGQVHRIEKEHVVVQTGSGARGLEYVKKSDIIRA
jgi:hypothetical protein